jgi:hypothetical protein
MAKAKKSKQEGSNKKPDCDFHQWGDIISIYEGGSGKDERYKVRFCRHCDARQYILNKKKDESDDVKTKG